MSSPFTSPLSPAILRPPLIADADRHVWDSGGWIADFVNGGAKPYNLAFTRASSAGLFLPTGTYGTVGNDVPRMDTNPLTLAPLGLLVEGIRTNGIRNSVAAGATVGVIGSGGAYPTNWTEYIAGTGNSAAITRQIVSQRTERGFVVTRIRISGTAAASGYAQIKFESNTGITAANGEVWTSSFFVGLAGGSTANISSMKNMIEEKTSAGAYITQGQAEFKDSLPADFINGRTVFARTLSGGGTVGKVQSNLTIELSAGAAIDITLDIAAPQLERGSFASSYIPTTGTAATRAAENAFISNLATIGYNQTQGTVYVEYVPMASTMPSYGMVFSLSDRSLNNRMVFEHTNLGNMRCRIQSGGSTIIGGAGFDGLVVGTVYKMALAYAPSDFAFSAGGSIRTSASSGTPPVVTDLTVGSFTPTATDQTYGWFRRVAVYPTRLTNAQINAMTA